MFPKTRCLFFFPRSTCGDGRLQIHSTPCVQEKQLNETLTVFEFFLLFCFLYSTQACVTDSVMSGSWVKPDHEYIHTYVHGVKLLPASYQGTFSRHVVNTLLLAEGLLPLVVTGHSSCSRKLGDLKYSGTGSSSLEIILYIDFFQDCSTSRPSWIALKNSLSVCSTTNLKFDGTCVTRINVNKSSPQLRNDDRISSLTYRY